MTQLIRKGLFFEYSMAFVFTLVLFFCFGEVRAQDEKEKFGLHVMKDSLDGKLDMSDFLIDFHGFIPFPQIITEPALGSFGLLLGAIFIQPNKDNDKSAPIPPDITAAFAGYTANDSWFAGGLRVASLPKYHLRYRIIGAYCDVNLDFYRELPEDHEAKFSFNFQTAMAYASILRQLGSSQVYLGLSYQYIHNDVKPNFHQDDLPDFVTDKDMENDLSNARITAEFDKRDNVFTPNSGWYITSDFQVNAKWTGSDYDFEKFSVSALKYFQFTPKWVSGYRFNTKFIFGDAPFYSEPSISMRGVPAARYQGDEIYLLETEQRYDFTMRWSGLIFGGTAKAIPQNKSFSNAELVYNYGTGFRYLLARKFGVRTGIDVAWSNEDFGWYIVFGTAWTN